MSVVWSCNEWDPLEEVVVGNPLRGRFPTADPSTRLAEYPDRPIEEIPQGPFPQWIIDETEEDLHEFIGVLEKLGVTVKRPETWPHESKFSTIHWESQGFYNYCPRDVMLVIGDHIIETPNVIRSRAQETFSYRDDGRLPEVGCKVVQCAQADAPGLAVRRRSEQAHATQR